MEQNKEYYVFISYKSEDSEWAIWLQHELEHYHLPASFNGRTDIRQDLRPVFRDTDELSAGNLPEQIQKALKNSQNLIVVCSPKAAKSTWVNQEIETFISIGKTNRIFPFIVEGNSPKEFFPPALSSLPKKEERLGGDINKNGRDAAFIKVVAGMLNLGFDNLWNRYEKEKAEEERLQREQRDNLLRLQSRFIAEKANTLMEQGDSYKAAVLALEALPNVDNPNRPLTLEAEMVLRKASEVNETILTGHTDIYMYSFSNDERFLTSVSHNKVCIWDLYNGIMVYSEETENAVTAAIFDEKNSILITAAENGENCIKIKDIKNGIYKYLKGHKSFVNFISLSSDSKMILSASDDKTVKLWDIENAKCIKTFYGHQKAINMAIFAKDNNWRSLKVPWNPILTKDSTYPIQEEWNISNAM